MSRPTRAAAKGGVAVCLAGVVLASTAACRPTLSGAAAVVGDARFTDTQLVTDVQQGYVEDASGNTSVEDYQRQRLTDFVLATLDQKIADRLGVSVDDQDVAATRTTFETNVGGASQLVTVAKQRGYGTKALDQLFRRIALDAKITSKLLVDSPPSDDYLRAQFESTASDTADLSFIELTDDATAQKVYALAKANPGQFAALAMQYSTDTQSKALGGEVGSQSKSQLPATIADPVFAATAGSVLAPITVAAGQIIILKVNSLQVADFDAQKATLKAAAEQPDSTYAMGLLTAAEQAAQLRYPVTISSRYGVWSTSSSGVEPLATNPLSSPQPSPSGAAASAGSITGTGTGTSGSGTTGSGTSGTGTGTGTGSAASPTP